MTRTQAAELIASRINEADDYSAKAWSKGGHVRVYVRENTGGKRGWIEAGLIDLIPAGEIAVSNETTFAFRYAKAILEAALAGVACEPEEVAAPVVVRVQAAGAQDETELQFEASQRAIYAAESARELG